jgi:hypothetical protein
MPPDVPEIVSVPVLNGVAFTGRTLMPDQVNEERRDEVLATVTHIVMVDAVGVTVSNCESPEVLLFVLMNASVPEPVPVTVTVTEFAVVSNCQPEGAFKIMLPRGIPASFDSVSLGPVNVVKAPDPPTLAVSAEMLALASIELVAVAKTDLAPTRDSPVISRNAMNDFFMVCLWFACSVDVRHGGGEIEITSIRG